MYEAIFLVVGLVVGFLTHRIFFKDQPVETTVEPPQIDSLEKYRLFLELNGDKNFADQQVTRLLEGYTPPNQFQDLTEDQAMEFLGVRRFNYSVDSTLDTILTHLIQTVGGIKRYHCDNPHEAEIIFRDDTRFKFWNANRDCAWLRDGEFIFTNGNNHKYTQARPKTLTMYRLKIMIDDYLLNRLYSIPPTA